MMYNMCYSNDNGKRRQTLLQSFLKLSKIWYSNKYELLLKIYTLKSIFGDYNSNKKYISTLRDC